MTDKETKMVERKSYRRAMDAMCALILICMMISLTGIAAWAIHAMFTADDTSIVLSVACTAMIVAMLLVLLRTCCWIWWEMMR